MTAPPAEPVAINGADRACVALLLELRDRIRLARLHRAGELTPVRVPSRS